MPIYTPRGLKICLAKEYAFTLIGRLYPEVDAFVVLKTTEVLASLPQASAFITALVCFCLRLGPVEIGAAVFLVTVSVATATRYGFYPFPSVVGFARIYTYVSGFGVLLIALVAAGLMLVGWQGVAGMVIGRVCSASVNMALEWRETAYYYSRTGQALSGAERNFINAYRLHATKFGLTTEVTVSDEEMDNGNWQVVLTDLAWKWPKVVARFHD